MNGDMPAFPIPSVEVGGPNFLLGPTGLTKREYIATQIMAGLGAFSVYSDNTSKMGALALRLADELLAALAAKDAPDER